MLIELTVGNYKSFKEKATFSMVASKIVSKHKEVDEHNTFSVGDGNSLRLIKSAAVYGANASGKSKLVEAIDFMRMFVMNSSKETQATEPIKVEAFRLSSKTLGKPSLFEAVFLKDHVQYRYGFEVDAKRVVTEWLYYVPSSREALLFERRGDQFNISRAFKGGRGVKEKTRDNALFLSVAAQFNSPTAAAVLTWFKDLIIISGLQDISSRPITFNYFTDVDQKAAIVEFIKKLDLGIDDIKVENIAISAENLPQDMPETINEMLLGIKGAQQTVVKTYHRIKNDVENASELEVFDMDKNESEGTNKLFSLAGPVLKTLKTGGVIIIDEFDARLHPLISRALIGLFNSNESNSRNAQLVFVTHDTNLLDKMIFRRDQVWFAEKDSEGATHLYSLAEYKVRNDATFEKDYVQGRYGAIPFIGDLSRLLS